MNLLSLVLEPLASSEAVLTDEEKEAGVVLVDIGGGTTDVAIYYDNVIRHTAVIPFGGNMVTQDIREVLHPPEAGRGPEGQVRLCHRRHRTGEQGGIHSRHRRP